MKPKWLFFSYTLPAKPSKPRVHVWRQLRKLGAVNCQAFWVLPFSKDRVEELKKLTVEVEGFGGQGLLIDGKVLAGEQEEQILRSFVDARNEEYLELIDKCEDYFKEIEHETQQKNFIFAEVEENEEELKKLRQWFKKIEKRDLMGAPLRKTAIEKLKACEKVYEEFARTVYEYQRQR